LSLGCYIQGENGIIFGKNVWVGPGVGIISANHSVDDFERHRKEKPIRIGDNCWIGMNAVILPGVELGEHVIVGAGSIVTRSFGPNCMIVGNPARVIKEISPYRNSTIEAKPERHSKE
jgi:acetyltransferase-like isoleucine patch superfamily enzyme